MAIASIADLWTPAIWIQGMRERMATFPSVLNSGIVVRDAVLDQVATGAGVSANLPFFKDITDQVDEIQVEDTAPVTVNGIGSGTQVTTILNRVTKNAVTALAGAVATGNSSDPVQAIVDQIVERRLKQRNTTLISVLRGAFNGSGASGAAAELSSLRSDSFDESGNDATSDQLLNADLFIRAKALLGELQDDLASGALLLHPNVLATLEIADKDSFKDGVESGLPFRVRTYRGIPIFLSSALSRAGTTNGTVYETYIVGRGAVGMGDKPQTDGIDVASLQYFPDPDANNQRIYDRTRFLIHLNGMKWVGTPAGQSATNAELATAANWDLAVSSAGRIPAVLIRTNG